MALTIVRTNKTNKDFTNLIDALTIEQAIRNGDKNSFYAQFNAIDSLDCVVVGYINHLPVACGALRTFDANSMEVKRMFTIKGERGKGVAASILKELEDWTAELGKSRCVLETGTMNPEAVQFYQKYNYKRIPNFGQYAKDEDSLCFEKFI